MNYVCNKCNGDGSTIENVFCKKCNGSGEIDWIDNIFGKDKNLKTLKILNRKLLCIHVQKNIKNYIEENLIGEEINNSFTNKIKSFSTNFLNNLVRNGMVREFIVLDEPNGNITIEYNTLIYDNTSTKIYIKVT